MRHLPVHLLLGALLICAAGADDARRAQVVAATQDAVDNLYGQIAQQPLDRNLSVQDLLQRTGGRPLLMAVLERAQQIGGPRWIDEHTCQVRLEISGARVAGALSRIAAANAAKTPIAAEALEWRLREWNRRTFGATGSSTGAAVIEQLIPPAAASAWSDVPEAARRQAIVAAMDDIVNRTIESIRPVPLAGATTIGDEMALPRSTLAADVADYVRSQPVTSLRFQDNRQVELRLGLTGAGLAQVVQQSLQHGPAQAALPASAAEWDRVSRDLAARMAPAVGIGRLPALTAQTTRTVQMIQVPAWADQQLDAQGVAPVNGAKLHAARTAQASAMQDLQEQVGALRLADGRSLVEWARGDPAVAQAIARAMERARMYRTDYRSDGTVAVGVSLDLQDLWEELRYAQ